MYRHLKNLWQRFKKHQVKQLARYGLKQGRTMQAKDVSIEFMCAFISNYFLNYYKSKLLKKYTFYFMLYYIFLRGRHEGEGKTL